MSDLSSGDLEPTQRQLNGLRRRKLRQEINQSADRRIARAAKFAVALTVVPGVALGAAAETSNTAIALSAAGVAAVSYKWLKNTFTELYDMGSQDRISKDRLLGAYPDIDDGLPYDDLAVQEPSSVPFDETN